MITTNAPSFCKQASCPSSETLLSYSAVELDSVRCAEVKAHLATCDFCCAEVQLLAECPQPDEDVTYVTQIPPPLRRLAEELLSGSFLTQQMFVESGYEKERLTLTDA